MNDDPIAAVDATTAPAPAPAPDERDTRLADLRAQLAAQDAPPAPLDERDDEIAKLEAVLRDRLNAAQRPGVAQGADRLTGDAPALAPAVVDARDREIAELKAALAQATGQQLDGTPVEEAKPYTINLACGDSDMGSSLWGTHHYCPMHGTVQITSASLTPEDAPKE